ncbi:hypothetical protein [Methylobacterium brachiatum]
MASSTALVPASTICRSTLVPALAASNMLASAAHARPEDRGAHAFVDAVDPCHGELQEAGRNRRRLDVGVEEHRSPDGLSLHPPAPVVRAHHDQDLHAGRASGPQRPHVGDGRRHVERHVHDQRERAVPLRELVAWTQDRALEVAPHRVPEPLAPVAPVRDDDHLSRHSDPSTFEECRAHVFMPRCLRTD